VSKSISSEFSFRTREENLKRFETEIFDLLVIGGGITGAATARDAATRGLRVALVEKNDFAYGTSSRSSKLIHGGLRYLENFEFGLVFEALAERALLLKTAPNMVRPLPFYFPVYQGDRNGKGILALGMWLYDLLALFRTPGFHKNLSRQAILKDIPFLKKDGLKGGFRYFDASMWDDVLVIETLRSASALGSAVANYVDAVEPLRAKDRVAGFRVRDLENPARLIELKAHQTVVCAGPWTDQVALSVDRAWKNWINPSKGVHLIFDLKRIPIPGAMVMSQPEDGRISFVIPRPDYGSGVVIVGTTDGPTPENPQTGTILKGEVDYLLGLLNRYFPDLKLSTSDILSAYVGVRPLMGKEKAADGSSSPLQKVSREHHIDRGPAGVVMVAGGKYTTHRKMAEEIVDYAIKTWREDFSKGMADALPEQIGSSLTHQAVNPAALPPAVKAARGASPAIPEKLFDRYGAEAKLVFEMGGSPSAQPTGDPDGFPCLDSELRFAIRREMALHLSDFYFRRMPLYSSRADHGLPWAERLSQIWAQERGLTPAQALAELARLKAEIELHNSWRF
jgi:glycerol-3-phosphate dehydrogenase